MAPAQIFPGVHALGLGPVNVFFIEEEGGGLTVVDAGVPGSEGRILEGARALGREPRQIRDIVLTHAHPDHAGSLAALLAATGARSWAHRLDAEAVRGNVRLVKPTHASPGVLNAILFRLFIANTPGEYPPARVDSEVADGDLLPFGGGLRAYHTPGHSAGHLAFVLERDGGLLFAGDTCSNMPRLGYSIVYDDIAEGRRSLARLAGLPFAAVCFGHGGALTGAAARRFSQMWGAA